MAQQQNNLRITLHSIDDITSPYHALAVVDPYENFSCQIALNDVRTCRVTFPITSEAAKQTRLTPLGRLLLKVRYRGTLIFFGYVGVPRWMLKARQVELNAIGAELKLMHHYFVADDLAVVDGIHVDGQGFEGPMGVIEAATLNAAQVARGVPDLLIVEGKDWRGDPGHAGGGLTQPRVGDNVWQVLTDIGDGWSAPDFEIEPIDVRHDPGGFVADALADPVTFPIPPIAQLNLNRQNRDFWEIPDPDVYPRVVMQGDFVQDRVKFQFGLGMDNLEDLRYAPDLADTRNFVGIGQDAERVWWKNEGSLLERGMFQMVEASGTDEAPSAVLDAEAKGQLLMWSEPPEYIEIDIRPETHYTLHYGKDYIVGDFCEVAAERGHYNQTSVHRIIAVEILREDQTKPIKQTATLSAELVDEANTAEVDTVTDGG